ncbi:MAG: hypothetical protein ACI8RZ_002473 [Myxococcota bacterium]
MRLRGVVTHWCPGGGHRGAGTGVSRREAAAGAGTQCKECSPLECSAMSGPSGQRWSEVARKRMAPTMANLNHPVREEPSESKATTLRSQRQAGQVGTIKSRDGRILEGQRYCQPRLRPWAEGAPGADRHGSPPWSQLRCASAGSSRLCECPLQRLRLSLPVGVHSCATADVSNLGSFAASGAARESGVRPLRHGPLRAPLARARANFDSRSGDPKQYNQQN